MCSNLVHLPRTVGYNLWDDDAYPLVERKQIASEVAADVSHLKIRGQAPPGW